MFEEVRVKDARQRRLQRDSVGEPLFPNPVPTDLEELLELMDEASHHAGTAQGAGAPSFDHGMRIFNQLKAHYDLRIALELAGAHLGLRKATNALKIATWWLAGITILLGAMELWKTIRGY